MAVGGGLGHAIGGNDAARTDSVFHHHWLTQGTRQTLAEQTRQGIHAAACALADDDAHGFLRKLLRLGATQAKADGRKHTGH